MLGGAAQRSAVATFHVPGPGHHRGAVGSCRAAVGQTRLPREQSRQLVGNGAQCTPRGSVASAGPPGLGRAPAAQPLTLALHPHRRTRWRTTWTRPSTCCAATPWALQATCTGCCPATGLWPPASPARSCRWAGGTTAWCVRGPERGRRGGSRAGPDSLPPVRRLGAATRRTASRAAAASCTATWPSPASPASSPTSRGRPTPTAVSPSVMPGQGGSPWPASPCRLLRGPATARHSPPSGLPPLLWKMGVTVWDPRALRAAGQAFVPCEPGPVTFLLQLQLQPSQPDLGAHRGLTTRGTWSPGEADRSPVIAFGKEAGPAVSGCSAAD